MEVGEPGGKVGVYMLMHVMCWRVGSPRVEAGPMEEQATPALELIIVY